MVSVLVVDDEEGLRHVMARLLSEIGLTVFEAADGNSALRLFIEKSPSLVIIDLIMPMKDGLEAIAEMKVLSPTVKIIAMSGGGRIHDMDFLTLAQRLGADAIIEKPFRKSELLEKLTQLMHEPSS